LRSNDRGRLGERASERKAAHGIVGIDFCQDRARRVAIPAHLLGKRLWRGENLVGAEKGDELDLDLRPV